MKVTVFGIGYVGLVQAAVLAEVGHEVVCVDTNRQKISDLNQGVIPIYEPGLAPLVQQNCAAGRLKFTTDATQGVDHAMLQFIAVGTPANTNGAADLQALFQVAQTIAEQMHDSKIIINKSTVPVGTSERVKKIIQQRLQQRGIELSFDVISNPEFLKEGAAIADCMRPDRIIIGTNDPNIKQLMNELYAPFNRNHDRLIFMAPRGAELTKYAANCLLATKISFMNEIANLAELLGVDVEEVRQGIGSDSRIGYHFIYPGCGYGGSCFPKDIQSLIHNAEEIGYQPKLLQAVEQINKQQKQQLFQKITHHFQGELAGRVFAVWGAAFKPNTDDIREAPSRTLIEALWQAGAKVQLFDPQALPEIVKHYGQRVDLQLALTKEEALQEADALIICTEWQNFRAPDFKHLKQKLRTPLIFDGRNLYDPNLLATLGFTYYAIGRGLPTIGTAKLSS
ncbi:MAG: UDP-glucose/GDP-mannose dehydrogenase family protein [Candidatus Symbiodolus clandestinus]